MICFVASKIFNTVLDFRGSKSNISENQSHHQEDFRHCNFRACFGVVVVFYLSVILTTTRTMVNGPLSRQNKKSGQSFWDGGSNTLGR